MSTFVYAKQCYLHHDCFNSIILKRKEAFLTKSFVFFADAPSDDDQCGDVYKDLQTIYCICIVLVLCQTKYMLTGLNYTNEHPVCHANIFKTCKVICYEC